MRLARIRELGIGICTFTYSRMGRIITNQLYIHTQSGDIGGYRHVRFEEHVFSNIHVFNIEKALRTDRLSKATVLLRRNLNTH